MEFDIAAGETGLGELAGVHTGTQDCEPGHAYGPAMREYVLVHGIHTGCGTFENARGHYFLRAGECFVIFPHEVTSYAADTDDPWSYTGRAFAGSRAVALLAEAGITQERPVFEEPAAMRVFEEIRSRFGQGDLRAARSGFLVLAEVLTLLDALRKNVPPGESRQTAYVRRAQEYMEKLYAGNMTIEGLAQSLGLDRRYLCRLFKAQTGDTPQGALVKTRMRHARLLLRERGLSVAEAARSVGYDDICNFSRMFRRVYGIPPTRAKEQDLP